jgi:oligosaccharyltransferase complex subunit beta
VNDGFSHPSFSPIPNSLLHAGVVSTNAVKSSVVLGSFADLPATKQGVLFRGIGHAVDDKNVLALKVLRGNPTTYSANPAKPIDDYPENAGADTLLATAMQARNNARILFTGSTALFSNAFFRTKLASGELAANEVFCAELSKWVFGQSGVLRFRDITHHKSDGTPPDVILHEKERPDLPQSLYPDPEITRNSLVYRIKDEIVYSMIVEESVNGQWKPFAANDMQMEFVMLDPHVRKTMTSDAKTGRFVASFIAPDNYGVFKFRVLYRRQGYSVLHAETHVSIRPFKHNEYERFIFSAYPYYSSAISALVAFFLFSVAFLGTKEKKG